MEKQCLDCSVKPLKQVDTKVTLQTNSAADLLHPVNILITLSNSWSRERVYWLYILFFLFNTSTLQTTPATVRERFDRVVIG